MGSSSITTVKRDNQTLWPRQPQSCSPKRLRCWQTGRGVWGGALGPLFRHFHYGGGFRPAAQHAAAATAAFGRMALPTAPWPACLYSTQKQWLGANLEGSPAVVDAVPAVELVPAEPGMVPTTEPRH